MSNSIKVLFFGLFKDIMGQKEFTLEIDNAIDFKKFLEVFNLKYEKFNKIKHFIEDKDEKQPVFVVLNGVNLQKTFEKTIQTGDEVAFLPPVGGG